MAIEYCDKLNEAIKKWEERYKRKHFGRVEIQPDFSIQVYDIDFVKALLKKLDLMLRDEDYMMDKLKDVKQKLTDV